MRFPFQRPVFEAFDGFGDFLESVGLKLHNPLKFMVQYRCMWMVAAALAFGSAPTLGKQALLAIGPVFRGKLSLRGRRRGSLKLPGRPYLAVGFRKVE